MDTLELPRGDARARGRAHGEHFRDKIHQLARLRTDLALSQGGLGSEPALLRVASAHLPILAGFDDALHEELLGVAEGADLEPARVVILNHYTDLKDIQEEDCTSVVAETPEDGPLLAQTWDMHGSAEPFVCMIRVPEQDGRPGLWTFTLTGCLALAGLNDAGLGVAINNLKSHDARVGVVWTALVRRLLAERGVRGAAHVLRTAPMGSGHHYLLADAQETCAIETSGERKALVYEARFGQPEPVETFIHANHCLAPEIDAVSWVSETSTSHERYAFLEASVEARPIAGRQDLWARLGSHENYPRSLCTHLATEENPHAIATCGAVLMDPARRELWATKGCAHEAEPEVFTLD